MLAFDQEGGGGGQGQLANYIFYLSSNFEYSI